MVFDTLLDELFDTLFDMGFDLTVWFGGRDGCVRTEARVEVRRRREGASGWKRREVRRVRREKAVMAVITSAMEVKALTTQASLGRLRVRRRRRNNSEEKHCWKKRGEDHTVCASGEEMTLEVRERGREDERKEARSELICCSCCSSSCRHRITCTRNNGGRWGIRYDWRRTQRELSLRESMKMSERKAPATASKRAAKRAQWLVVSALMYLAISFSSVLLRVTKSRDHDLISFAWLRRMNASGWNAASHSSYS